VAAPPAARFAVFADPAGLAGLDRFDAGSDESPEAGATLIVQARRLNAGYGARLSGPGIVTEHRVQVDGVADAFWAERRRMQALFPRGLDIFFACDDQLTALPRTTQVRV
jgi:alpha-D-ribose 1-methylphosphonate 5-triphosphate synthase subunit PhnH